MVQIESAAESERKYENYRQKIGENCRQDVKRMTQVLQIRFWKTNLEIADFFSRAHRVECAGYDLRGASAQQIVARLGLQQLRVGEDDSELVVQSVEEET